MARSGGGRRWSGWLLAAAVVVAAGVFGFARPAHQAQPATAQCPLAPGYWKNHPEAWPRQVLTLGASTSPAHTYTQGELLALLHAPVRGDASLSLAHQLIAAKLNVASGAGAAPVALAVGYADWLLGRFPGKLPYRVTPHSKTGLAMLVTAEVLELYNTGRLPHSCGGQNTAPTAKAGPDQTVFVGVAVQLDGSGSTDVDGDLLSFRWSLAAVPAGSAAALSDPFAVRPTFLVDRPGTYVLQLVVSDGTRDSAPDTVQIDTENSRPVASAGANQTVAVGDLVQLDGSASSDVDGQAVAFHWRFVVTPAGSQATLTDDRAAAPAFVADVPGHYAVELVVNDGALDSVPDTVEIDTVNSRPRADAGPDQTATAGDVVQLDGRASSDVDGDPVGFRWSFTTRPDGSTASLSDPTAAQPAFAPDVPGLYVVQLIVSDGTADSLPDTIAITVEPRNLAPAVGAGPDQAITLPTSTVTLAGSVTDDGLPAGGTLTLLWSVVSGSAGVTIGTPAAVTTTATFATPGLYVLRLTASDGALGASDDVSVTVNQANAGPVVDAGPDQTITLPGTVTLTGSVTDDGLPAGGTLTLGWSTVSGPGTVTFSNPDAASTTGTFSTSGEFVLRLTASDGQLSSSDDLTVTVSPASGGLPPDPGTVAPPLDPTVPSDLARGTEFLYMGPDPIQTGVAPGTIEARRAAVVRGTVLTREGAPLPGVRITVLGHPELGQTLSRGDGLFDLAVNGGGLLTVDYQKAGFLPAQRQVQAPWRDYAWLSDVVLIPVDPRVTPIDLPSAAPIQVARGSVMTDDDGTRQATLLFPRDTVATMVFPDGSTQPITRLSVRATEYTVGPNGPRAMPAELPPASAYTYAVEFSVDEAKAAGAIDVRFSSPLPFYVENFLGFPVGLKVPLGAYDRARGTWVASDSGRVIKVVSATGGLADVDTDGDGAADGGLGLTDAERQQLASLYAPGQSVWRMLIPHFDQPWDANWGFGPPEDAEVPAEDPEPDEPQVCRAEVAGSIIGCQDQTLGEALGVVGTAFGLHYRSDRVPGRELPLQIPLSGSAVPASLVRIELRIAVAGRLFGRNFPPAPNQRTTFTWDRKDAYGRALQGSQPITVRTGYTYGAVYQQTPRFGSSGNGIAITASPARQEVTLWRTWSGRIETWDVRAVGLGGWTLSPHHVYHPGAQVLHRGDGRSEHAQAALGPIIETFAGPGLSSVLGNRCHDGDGQPAIGAQVCAEGLASGPDGSLYVADRVAHRVRKVDPDGIITTVAGTGVPGSSGDGGPAAQAQLSFPEAVAVGPDQSLYIASPSSSRIRRVGTDGIIATIAGSGVQGFSGDGGPAPLAQLRNPDGVAVGPDNAVYVNDRGNRRIRLVGADGIITTVAGTGNPCLPTAACGDGGPATQAQLFDPRAIAVGRDGSLYIADAGLDRVRRVTPDGIIRTIAGTGIAGFSGDDGPATLARLNSPSAVAVGSDDTVYITDSLNNRIRWMRLGGTITTFAGTGDAGRTGDGGLALQATLQVLPIGLAIGADGSVYTSQRGTADLDVRVRRIAAAPEQLVLSEVAVVAQDGSEVYVFGLDGRHRKTLDALTGAVRHDFAYDGAGRLVSVTDGDGNVTMVERDGAGNPTAIVGPFGQRTALILNPDGYLGRVVSPAGEAVALSYTADGLLTGLTSPGGHTSSYVYDGQGRLMSATDPTGATKTLARTGTNRDSTVTLTDALGRATSYRVERLGGGAQRVTTTDPAGSQVQAVIGRDGSQTATHPDGTRVDVVLGPDPRWGMRAPVPARVTATTPGGKVHTTTTARTATLADPSDPLSLLTFTETVTVNGRVLTTTYDATTRTLTHSLPSGRRYTALMDDRGRLVQEHFGDLAPTSYTYDAQGRLATATQAEGAGSRVTRSTYGADGFLASITDPIGLTVGFTKDAAGRVIELTRADGRPVRFAYDASGNVRSLTPPERPEHTLDYTAREEIGAYTAPAVGAGTTLTRYAHGADRQPLRTDQPDGQTAEFQYDSAGRLSVIDLVSGDLSYAYDAAGRLSTLGTPAVSLAYAYDGGLPTSESWSGAVTGSVTRTYDSDFRLATLGVDGVPPVAIQYDADGLPVQVGDLTLTRAALSGLITATALGTVTDATSHDGFGDPAGYTASQAGSPLFAAQYSRDALRRLTDKSETIGAPTRALAYSYDLTGRLTEVRQDGAPVASYTYDANGNRLTRSDATGTVTATYDAQDRLVQHGATTYAYTPNGELSSRTAGGQTTTYRYDGLGNLTGVTLPDGTQIEYLLDGLGRRVGRKVNGTMVQGLLYNGLRPIAELDGAGNVTSRFVYAGGGNIPAYLVRGDVTYRVISDHLGSPRLVLDVATGQVAQRLDYDAFGNVTEETLQSGFAPIPFGFAGGLHDRDTGLVHFGAREYDPETGRWTTKDPIRFAGGDGNLYAYAGNDPVNNVDLAGLICTNSVDCTCMRHPNTCAQIATLAGTGTEAARRGAEAASNLAPAVTNAVSNLACRISTLPGMPDTIDQLAKTAPRLAQIVPRLTQASSAGAQAVPRILPRINLTQQMNVTGLNPVWDLAVKTLRAAEGTEFYRSLTLSERADFLQQIFQAAERLLGGG
jgi:RHS repeat-associated protein